MLNSFCVSSLGLLSTLVNLKRTFTLLQETKTNSCHYYNRLACIKQETTNCSFSQYLLQLLVYKNLKQYSKEIILKL